MLDQRLPNARPRTGFAHLATLFACLLIAILAGQFVMSQRQATLGLVVAQDRAAARQAADSGARLAIAELANHPDSADRFSATRGWQRAGDAWLYAVSEDAAVSVQVTSEAEKLDLNRAPRSRLEPLLLSALGDPAEAARLSQAILDYRRSDGLADLDTPAPGRPVNSLLLRMSKDSDARAFDTVEELLAVPGMDRAKFARLSALVTVSGGYSDAAAYTIRAEARLENGAHFIRLATVDIFPGRGQPSHVIRRWRQAGS